MYKEHFKYPVKESIQLVVKELKARKVSVMDIAREAWKIQENYTPEWDINKYVQLTNQLLHNHEVLNTLMVGFHMDNMATQGILPQPLQEIMEADCGSFELDEIFGLNISGQSSTTGITNFGKLDCNKIPMVKRVDTNPDSVNTFSDDLISGLIAGVCGLAVREYYYEFVYTVEN